jgi:hypothetical protein
MMFTRLTAACSAGASLAQSAHLIGTTCTWRIRLSLVVEHAEAAILKKYQLR